MNGEVLPKEGIIFLLLIFVILVMQLVFFLNVLNKGFLFVLFLFCCLFFFFFWDSSVKRETLNNFLKVRESRIKYVLPEIPKEFP